MAEALARRHQEFFEDLERLHLKERPFEGGRNRRTRRMSDPDMDEIDNILFKEFKSLPDIKKKHQSLIPHLLALDRVQKFMELFLREKAKEIAGSDVNTSGESEHKVLIRRTVRFRRPSDIDFQWRNIDMSNQLSVLSFFYELMMKSVRTRQEIHEENIQEVLELSNNIAAAQLVITDFQTKIAKCHESSGMTETEIAQLCSKLDRIRENIAQAKIEARFEMEDEILQQFFNVPSRICHALGLNIDFLHWFDFENFPDDVQNHMSIENWVCNFLRESYKEAIENIPQTTLNDEQKTEALRSIGFRPDGMAFKTILTRTSSLATHLELIDHVELFIRDEFKYNVVLSDRICARFPYNQLQVNEWFPLLQLVATHSKEAGEAIEQNVCSAINLEHREQIESRFSKSQLEDETHIILFHGTDHESAKDILNGGIEIAFGKQKRDFSDGAGFYLTNDLNYSVHWAFSKTSKPAVLIYRVSKEMLDTFSKLSLCSEEKQTQWKEIVNQFRSGKPDKKLRKYLREIDFIEGPQASSFMLPPVARQGSYQMCVISDELAEEFQNSIHSVLFLDGTVTDF